MQERRSASPRPCTTGRAAQLSLTSHRPVERLGEGQRIARGILNHDDSGPLALHLLARFHTKILQVRHHMIQIVDGEGTGTAARAFWQSRFAKYFSGFDLRYMTSTVRT